MRVARGGESVTPVQQVRSQGRIECATIPTVGKEDEPPFQPAGASIRYRPPS